jgi:hypothetical protein
MASTLTSTSPRWLRNKLKVVIIKFVVIRHVHDIFVFWIHGSDKSQKHQNNLDNQIT